MSKKIKSILWVVAGLVGAKILNEITYPIFNSPSTGVSPIRAFIPALIATLFVGFFVYKAYETYKTDDVDEIEGNLKVLKNKLSLFDKKNLSISVIGILVILVIATNFDFLKKIVNKEKIYNVYSCSVPATYLKDECGDRQLKMTAKFLIDKERQQVVVEYTKLDVGTKHLVSLKNCVVVDFENWKCGDVLKSEDYGLSYDGAYQMIGSEVSTTDSFVGGSRIGKGTLYVKANLFKLK